MMRGGHVSGLARHRWRGTLVRRLDTKQTRRAPARHLASTASHPCARHYITRG